jgi:hypothetical protein
MKIKYKIVISFIIGILILFLTPNSIAVINLNFREYDNSVNKIVNEKEYRAILIGIKDYPGDFDLPYSINEILSFKETLLNGGNWNDQNIKVITDSQATKSNIYDAIDWLKSNADTNDISVFYYAGHGGRTTNNEYLLVYNSSISDIELDDKLDEINGEIVVILDCCYSGGFIEEVGERDRIILTACKKDELTYQVRNLSSGIFGYFLNISLKWITKSVEATFLLTRFFCVTYSKKLSHEFNGNYTIHPRIYDGNLRKIRLIDHHSYDINIIRNIISNNINIEDFKIWRM